MKTILTAPIVIMLAASGCSERDRMALGGEGLVASGEKLAVAIGSTEQTATRTLLMQGLSRAGVERGGSCLSPRTFKADYTVQFLDMSWRRGTVCLGVTRGRVTQIAWLYNALSP